MSAAHGSPQSRSHPHGRRYAGSRGLTVRTRPGHSGMLIYFSCCARQEATEPDYAQQKWQPVMGDREGAQYDGQQPTGSFDEVDTRQNGLSPSWSREGSYEAVEDWL